METLNLRKKKNKELDYRNGQYVSFMLAFDIETEGLDGNKHDVTVVCTQNFHTNERKSYEFKKVKTNNPHDLYDLREELIKDFDNAESLCAFNGVRFDIPFLHKALKLPDATVVSWLIKTTDILEACRSNVYGPRHTFSLNLLCEINGVDVKSSNGLQAIIMAREQRWEDLKEYCEDDVQILCNLYRQKTLKNPRSWDLIDLTQITCPSLWTIKNEPVKDLNKQVVELKKEIAFKNDIIAKLQEELSIFHGQCTCL